MRNVWRNNKWVLHGVVLLGILVVSWGCAPDYTLEIEVEPADGGKVLVEPQQTVYRRGQEITLTAQAEAGWRFVEWRDKTDAERPRCGRPYTPIAGADNSVVVEIRRNMRLLAVFEKITSGQASLTVTLEPEEAVAAGAQWRLSRELSWRASSDAVSNLASGEYTVLFRAIPGWDAPEALWLPLQAGQDAHETGVYATTMPRAPENLMAAPGASEVLLTWDEQLLYTVVGYHVYRTDSRRKGVVARLTGDTPVRALRYRDTEITPGLIHGYWVTAVTSKGVESAPSDTIWSASGVVRMRLPIMAIEPGVEVRVPIAVENAAGLSADTIELLLEFRDNSETLTDLLVPESLAVVTTAITQGTAPEIMHEGAGRIRIVAGTPDAPALVGEGRLFELAGRISDGIFWNEMFELRIDGSETVMFQEDRTIFVDTSAVGLLVASEDCMRGDLDNNKYVEYGDTDLLMRLAARFSEPEPCHWQAGDLNLDNRLDSADAVIILRVLAGWYDTPEADGVPTLRDLLRPTVPVTVSVSGGATDAGEELVVPVAVRIPGGMFGAEITVGWPANDEQLRLIGAAPDPAFDTGAVSINTTIPGIARIALGRPEEALAPSDSPRLITLARLRFQIGAGVTANYAPPINILGARIYGPYGELADWYTDVVWVNDQIIVTPLPLEEGEPEIAPALSVSPMRRDVAARAGNTEFYVANYGGGNMSWSARVVVGGDWLTITSGATGVNAGVVRAFHTANTDYESRTAAIDIVAPDTENVHQTVRIIQAAITDPCATDLVPPEITLLGAATMTVECGTVYTDPGATALDNCDGNLTSAIVVGGDWVNTGAPGVYIITYNVSDAAGNAATPITRTVSVVDTAAPALLLVGSATVTVECGAAYTDAGATALDSCAGDITANIVVGGDTVNSSTPGDYIITYNVSDASGNAGAQITRTVSVVDTAAPALVLAGSATVTVECGVAYTDAGATALDNCAGNITANIVVGGDAVNSNTPGVYTVTYNVSDASGNAAAQITRSITVEDTEPPLITLAGETEVALECGMAYMEPGLISVSDQCDGVINVEELENTLEPEAWEAWRDAVTVTLWQDAALLYTSSLLRIETAFMMDYAHEPGEYRLRYELKDGADNTGHADRTVVISDATAPILTLLGNAAETIECGVAYADAGALAYDACDGDLTADITIGGDMVDANTPGVYVVSYNVSDAAGNEAVEVIRTVTVEDTQPPNIALAGDTTVLVGCGAPYLEAGLSEIMDQCEGILDVQEYESTLEYWEWIQWRDAVPVSIWQNAALLYTSSLLYIEDTFTNYIHDLGEYTLHYEVTDTTGNTGHTERIVTVADTTPPEITLLGAAEIRVECGDVYSDAGAEAFGVCGGDLTDSIMVGGDIVDASAPGVYFITYNVIDTAGSPAEEVVRVVIVEDTIPPMVTLGGEGEVFVECSTDYYYEAGLSVIADQCDGVIDVVEYEATLDLWEWEQWRDAVTVTLWQDATLLYTSSLLHIEMAFMMDYAHEPGEYILRYEVTDDTGNTGHAERNVYVVDSTPPIITMWGDAEVTLSCGDVYTDAGASASDACDGVLTENILVDSVYSGHFPVPGPDFQGCGVLPYASLPQFDIMVLGDPVDFTSARGNYDFCAYADTVYCSFAPYASLEPEFKEVADLFQCRFMDINGPPDWEAYDPLTPNGMLDGQYELGILAYVLNTPAHPLHLDANTVFEENFQVFKDLIVESLAETVLKFADNKDIRPLVESLAPHLTSSMSGLLAAMATLGDEDTYDALDVALTLMADIGLEPPEGGIATITQGVPALGPYGDADGDGFTNIEEYFFFVDGLSYLPAAFVAAAMDPNQTPPPDKTMLFAPSFHTSPKDESLVDTNTPGTYTITYQVADDAGNSATVTRVVVVLNDCEVDEGEPDEGEGEPVIPTRIVLLGEAETLAQCGYPFGNPTWAPDPGAVVYDQNDQTSPYGYVTTLEATVAEGLAPVALDTLLYIDDMPYIATYTALGEDGFPVIVEIDGEGNTGTLSVSRTIYVEDTLPPEIHPSSLEFIAGLDAFGYDAYVEEFVSEVSYFVYHLCLNADWANIDQGNVWDWCGPEGAVDYWTSLTTTVWLLDEDTFDVAQDMFGDDIMVDTAVFTQTPGAYLIDYFVEDAQGNTAVLGAARYIRVVDSCVHEEPEECIVPDVSGLSVGDALAVLDVYGFTEMILMDAWDDATPAGLVSSQLPDAGPYPCDGVVQLVVSFGPEPLGITLYGADPAFVECGELWEDPGAVAYDAYGPRGDMIYAETVEYWDGIGGQWQEIDANTQPLQTDRAPYRATYRYSYAQPETPEEGVMTVPRLLEVIDTLAPELFVNDENASDCLDIAPYAQCLPLYEIGCGRYNDWSEVETDYAITVGIADLCDDAPGLETLIYRHYPDLDEIWSIDSIVLLNDYGEENWLWTPGAYIVVYRAQDSAGNTVESPRYVIVCEIPESGVSGIALFGDNPMHVPEGSVWNDVRPEPGAAAWNDDVYNTPLSISAEELLDGGNSAVLFTDPLVAANTPYTVVYRALFTDPPLWIVRQLVLDE